jgi:run domain Beclin-1 interacting cysteine-rich containing protein
MLLLHNFENMSRKINSYSVVTNAEVTSSGSASMSSSSEDVASSSFSAENIALNLLRNAKMKDVKLPDASELKWLVTERDAPQTLLPLPKNWNSASESETDSLDKSMRLRGTTDWAPPRPQIIFTIHASPQ